MRKLLLALILAIPFMGAGHAYHDIADWNEPTFIERDLHEIFETGTYYTLREYRRETDLDVLPWIDSIRDFNRERDRLDDMEEALEEIREDARRDRRRQELPDRGHSRVREDTFQVVRRDRDDPDVYHIFTYPSSRGRPGPHPRYGHHRFLGDHPLWGHYSLRHHYP